MGNYNPVQPQEPQNLIVKVATPYDLPEDVRIEFITRITNKVKRQLENRGARFDLYSAGVVIWDQTQYQIDSVLPILPEVLEQLPEKDLWSYTVHQQNGLPLLVFRKIFNSSILSSSSEIPTHIAQSVIRTAIEKGDTCPILLTPLTEETAVLTSCGHLFSKEGLTSWFTSKPLEHNCPTCSKHVTKLHSLQL